MKRIDVIKHCLYMSVCFFFSNVFSVILYGQIYTYILYAFNITGRIEHVIYFIGMLAGYFHSMYIFIYSDTEKNRNDLKKGVKNILACKKFIYSNLVFLVLTSIVSPDFGLFNVSYIIFYKIKVDRVIHKVLITAVMTSVNFILFIVSFRIAQERCSKTSSGEKKRGAIFWRIGTALLAYIFLLGIAVKCIVIVSAYTLMGVQLILWAVPVIFLVTAVLYAHSLIKRKKYIKKLEALCIEKGVKFFKRGDVFDIISNEKSYSIRILGFAKSILNAVYLLNDNKICKRKFEKISEALLGRLSFGSDNAQKIFVIINLFGASKSGKFIENGERISGYRVFYGKSFMRALENGYLEK